MTPLFADDMVTLHAGDCLDVLRTLPDTSVDAVVTDPPYGLAEHSLTNVAKALAAWASGDRTHVPDGRGFMGRSWDAFVPPPGVWDECYRVLKPGGHLLAFSGSRTVDLMTMSIRFGGFEIRDTIMWLYGSGFPKSLDVSKAIDKAAGELRGHNPDLRNGPNTRPGTKGDKYSGGYHNGLIPDTGPVTDDARRWQGWGTALKPASEPIVVARKPLAGTVAGNVLAHGTGALNIDACRVGPPEDKRAAGTRTYAPGTMAGGKRLDPLQDAPHDGLGRWPTNVVLSHAATPDGVDLCGDGCVPGCPVAELDAQSGVLTSGAPGIKRKGNDGPAYGAESRPPGTQMTGFGDSGGASRFFPVFRYEAKAPTSERPRTDDAAHPTVKPLDLMRWLVRLVTPPGGLVLDPFAGSGTTAEACVLEGFRCTTVERDPSYLPLIVARLSKPLQPALFGGAP